MFETLTIVLFIVAGAIAVVEVILWFILPFIILNIRNLLKELVEQGKK